MSRLSFLLAAVLLLLVSIVCTALSIQTSVNVYQRDGAGGLALMWATAFAVAIPLRMLVVWNAKRMRRAAEGPFETLLLTHKGWFGIVPVYLLDTQDDGVAMEPRYRLPMLLLEAQAAIFNFIGTTGGFPIKVTGKLATPKAFKFKVPGDPVMAS